MDACQAEGAEVWVCDAGGPRRRRRDGCAPGPGASPCGPGIRGGGPPVGSRRDWYDEVAARDARRRLRLELVWLRIDPPVDARYLHTTYLLDLAVAAGVRVVNHPAGVRALHEKLLALALPDLCPATLVRRPPPPRSRPSCAAYGTAVVKPVDGFAGTDVWLLERGPHLPGPGRVRDPAGGRHVIVQEYLPAVADGNKRLFLVDGEIVGAVLRRPSDEDFRIGPPVAAADRSTRTTAGSRPPSDRGWSPTASRSPASTSSTAA